MARAQTTSRQGVAYAWTAASGMRCSARMRRRPVSSCSVAGGRNRAGISSHPISSRKSRSGMAGGQWKAERFAEAQIPLGRERREVPDAEDVFHAFRHADGAAGVEEIERVGTFLDELVARQNESGGEEAFGLGFERIKQPEQNGRIRFLEIVRRLLPLVALVHFCVGETIVPLQVIDVIDALKRHADAFESVGEFDRDRVELDPADFLEIRE